MWLMSSGNLWRNYWSKCVKVLLNVRHLLTPRSTFRRIEHLVHKQVSRPFLKRYLKRDEDAWKIAACNVSLTDTVGMFSVAIQLRLLKEVREQTQHFDHPNIPAHIQPHEIVPAIATIRNAQATHDSASDVADLYAAMRGALRLGSDIAMLDILQVCRISILPTFLPSAGCVNRSIKVRYKRR